ncbi:hypothetical protein AADZ90_014030 [Aestuariibius sp. 2305UL40-4]|uniref:hypothetical protein n=1 Tax=Aestuariibius violaceus TaxID=3234132 RepID=UPI00345E9C8B
MRLGHVLAWLAMGLAPMAAHAERDPGRAIAELFATQMDADRDGVLEDGEVIAFSEAVFSSMDIDGSGGLTFEEMRDWEHGMADLATFRHREEAFDASIGMAFALFDRDRDGLISPAEYKAGVRIAAGLADGDKNGTLTVNEYLDGFIFNVAMRTALAG